MSGLFITFEGTEGCGKSTQIESLSVHLKKSGYNVSIYREPGGTAIGETIRTILQSPSNLGKISPITELLLFTACRAELSDQLIKPALKRGEIVICDRFYDSTYVYQGIGRSLDKSIIEQLKNMAVGLLKPDLTFVLDLDAELGLQRARSRQSGELDRIESESLSFFEQIRQGYLDLAKSEPNRFCVLDASQSIKAIEALIWQEVQGRFFK